MLKIEFLELHIYLGENVEIGRKELLQKQGQLSQEKLFLSKEKTQVLQLKQLNIYFKIKTNVFYTNVALYVDA